MPPPASTPEWADPSMVGRKLKLRRPIVSGHGEIEFGGRVWKAVAREDLDSGTRVRIAGVDGHVVKLEKA